MNSQTYDNKDCGLNIHITVGDKIFIRCGKSGSCQSVMWEVIAKLINNLDRTTVIKILKGYQCEKAFAGHKSCFNSIARLLEIKEDK
jgi:hypothetical protein